MSTGTPTRTRGTVRLGDDDRPDTATAAANVLARTIERLSLARTHAGVSEVVADAARTLVGADGVVLVRRYGDVCECVAEWPVGPGWAGVRRPLHDSLSGWVIRNRRAMSTPDVDAESRVPTAAHRPRYMRAMTMLPVRRSEPLAALGFYWSDARQPSAAAVEQLQAIADSTAVVLENITLREDGEAIIAERASELARASGLHSEMTRALAHEIRNPLAAAEGLLRLVLDEDPVVDAPLREDLEHARAALDDGLRIVTAQLERARRGNAPHVRPSLVDAGEIVRGLAATGRGLRRDERVAVAVDIDDDLVGDALRTDGDLLVQLLRNLVSNAMKFTDEGEVRIGVKRVGSQAVRFTVSDTGLGIAHADLERVFRPFEQVDGAQAGRLVGDGLGLGIVRHLANKLLATVAVTSEEGVGTRFSVTVPSLPDPTFGC